MVLEWIKLENNVDDAVTVLKKNGISVFYIIEGRNGYMANYWNNRLYTSPVLSYLDLKQKCLDRYGVDTAEKRLEYVQDYFMRDYQEQSKKLVNDIKEYAV